MKKGFEAILEEEWDARRETDQSADPFDILCRREEQVRQREIIEVLRRILRTLPDRERQVVTRCVGWNGSAMSFAAAGRDLGVSRQRAAQLFHSGIARMRRVLDEQRQNADLN